MQRFDVYLLELQWRNCLDRRPAVVLSPQWYLDERLDDDVVVGPASSARSLFDERCHFLIREADAEFVDTGLKRESYIAVDYVTHVERTQLRRCIGHLGEGMSARLCQFASGFFQFACGSGR